VYRGGIQTSFCDYHPDREAVGQCSICGKNICSECAGHDEGPIVCIHCKGTPNDRVWVSSKQPSPSPWDTSIHTDKRAHNYFIVGMFGAFLWILVNVVGVYTQVLIMLYQAFSLILQVAFLLIVTSIVGLFYPLLFGVGFLGLSIKYNEQYARYVFYAYVASLLMTFISGWLRGAYILYSPATPVLFVPGILNGGMVIITIVLGAFSQWRLRNKSNHSNLFVFSAVLFCLYTPLAYLLVLIAGPIAYYLASYTLETLLAILMMGLFFLESRLEGEGVKALRTW
jgi:hypothetical protein